VHPVHQLAFRAKNHGIPKIRLLNEFHVSHKNPDRCRFPICAEPIHSVQFTEVSETHLLNRQVGREFDQTMNVPGVISLVCRLEEILLSHDLQYSASNDRQARPTEPAVWDTLCRFQESAKPRTKGFDERRPCRPVFW